MHMHKHATLGECGGMLPVELHALRLLPFGHLGQKHSCSSCMAHRALHPIFSCPYAFAKPGDVQFPREKVLYSWQNSIVSGDPLEGRLVNS